MSNKSHLSIKINGKEINNPTGQILCMAAFWLAVSIITLFVILPIIGITISIAGILIILSLVSFPFVLLLSIIRFLIR